MECESMSIMSFVRGSAIVAALALVGGAAAASTVQPGYQSVSSGSFQNGSGTALWQFGTIWDGRPWGDRLHGHSTVRMTGSNACTTAAAGSECLFATIDYFNAVNLGAGTGNLDTATGAMTHTGLGLQVALRLTVDRTSNSTCASLRYGCPDQFTVAFTSPMDGFRVVGSGAWVQEDRGHSVQIFWTRPAPTESISAVPLPASGLMLGAIALAGVAAARRRKAG
jgi:hypothetical protein